MSIPKIFLLQRIRLVLKMTRDKKAFVVFTSDYIYPGIF